jgi:hypothetical protein
MAADFGRDVSLPAIDFHQIQAAAVAPARAGSVANPNNNTISTATNLGVVQGIRTIADRVDRTDTNDFFRFDLDESAELGLRLDQLQADIDLYLYNSAGQLIGSSDLGAKSAEQILLNLAAGTYYARVMPYNGAQSNYRLKVDVDVAGETMAAARNLGALSGTATSTDWIGSGDANDYFRFSVNQQSQATLRLDQLAADLDLYLYNSAGQQIGRSDLGGTSADQIQLTLANGTYYARVMPYNSAQSNYRLAITVGTTGGGGANPLPDVGYYGGSNDWNLNLINAPEAWARGYTGSGVVVAVIDSGVDFTHSDLSNNMWFNDSEIGGNGRDDDANGYVDDLVGYDFVNYDSSPWDQNGHGTHVAGTIAAARNGVGATGVAYGARIMAVQVLDGPPGQATGSYQSIAEGIRYAVDNGAHVLNMSLGGAYSQEVASALSYANQRGVFVAIASGNESAGVPSYPAIHASQLSGVISVGSHTSSNTRSSFSNRVGNSGVVQVDGPGSDVYSTMPSGYYGTMSGTSMATPHVAGLAALAWSANPNLSASQLRQVIAASANRTISGSDSIGGINAALAVPLAMATSGSAANAPALLPAFGPSSPGSYWSTGLSPASVDAMMAFDFSGTTNCMIRPNAAARVAITPVASQVAVAHEAVIEAWRPESPSDDFRSESAGAVQVAFESAWNDLADDLLGMLVA